MMLGSKRKNDDKPKGLPQQRLKVVMGLLAATAALVGVVILFRPDCTCVPGEPTGHLYYHTTNGQTGTIYDLNLGTGKRTLLVGQIPQSPSDGTLSPDGLWQVIEGYPEGKIEYSDSELWLLNTQTQEKERLTNNNFADMWPMFSPDGTKIAYVATPDGYRRPYVMDLSTREITALAPDMYSYWLVWSPDSQWIAFTTDHAGSFDVWIVRADGSERRPIAITPDRESDPLWLP